MFFRRARFALARTCATTRPVRDRPLPSVTSRSPLARNILPMAPTTRFLILTNGRSGSNHLVNRLNLHPRAANYGEVLGEWTASWKRRRLLGLADDTDPANVAAYLDRFFTDPWRFYAGQAAAAGDRLRRGDALRLKRWGQIDAIGLKDFQLVFEQRRLPDYAASRDWLKVVVLARANPVRRFVSSLLLSEGGQIAVRDGERPAFTPLTVDPDRFLRGVRTVAAENDALARTATSLPPERRFLIEYEDFFETPGGAATITAALFAFLDLPHHEATSSHRKINVRPLSQTLANYDAIAERLAGTEFAARLD